MQVGRGLVPLFLLCAALGGCGSHREPPPNEQARIADAGSGILDARTTPASRSAPITQDARALPDFALFRDCEQCPDMVVIPGGHFLMGRSANEQESLIYNGEEEPRHRVHVRRFAMGRFEVTASNWSACIQDGGCDEHAPGGWDQLPAQWPVIAVSWRDAQSYVGWLNKRATGALYRLPSEAEWEYGARAGTATAFNTGDTIDRTLANFGGGWQRGHPVDVGTYPPNAWGLFDTAGNVAEWAQDCWAPSYVGMPVDGTAFEVPSCAFRVFRGGTWAADEGGLRAAWRGNNRFSTRTTLSGFRVARSLNQEQRGREM